MLIQKLLRKVVRCKLHSLVRIEYVRLSDIQGLIKALHAKVGIEGIVYPPGLHIPAEPVHNGYKVTRPFDQLDISYIRAPDLVGPDDFQLFE